MQVVEFDLTGGRTIRDGIAQRELEIRRVEPLAAERREGQCLGEKLAPLVVASPSGPARQMCEVELGNAIRQARLDVCELEVSDDLPRLTLRELEPDA